METNKAKPGIKSELHPRNKHRGSYDFLTLINTYPGLEAFVVKNKLGNDSINFFDVNAVKALNKALLLHHYGLSYWDIPSNYLCPPIPGRADYIHHVADLLASDKRIGPSTQIKCLDIGVGANCIYPIIGVTEYNWKFAGSDIDPEALKSAGQIIDANPVLKNNISVRFQDHPEQIFKGIINSGETFHLSICNPPFHRSADEAHKGTLRKVRNLKGKAVSKAKPNFGGQSNELWCEGGEKQFVVDMILESREFAHSFLWFTTLISKETNLPKVHKTLQAVKAQQVKTIEMGQGNKKSRIVCWRF